MSRLKACVAALSVLSCPCAQASEGNELAEIAANCAGRLSAEVEFAWLLRDPEAETLDAQRSRFLDILDSLGPQDDSRWQLARRIEAKVAHAALLSKAHFATNKARAIWAERRARAERTTCQSMLLES